MILGRLQSNFWATMGISLVSIATLVLGGIASYEEFKEDRKKPEGAEFYTLSLDNKKAQEIFDSFMNLQKPGDCLTIHETDGRRLVIYKA